MNRITLIFGLLLLLNCSTDDNNSEPVEPPPQNVVCDCPTGNIQTTQNDLLGYWVLNKRTLLDVTGIIVTEVQDFATITPCDENALHLKVFLNSQNKQVMSVPVGGLLRPAPTYCGRILNFEFPIVHYQDGGSCLKLLTTSPSAGHKLCLIEFTSTTLKIKMKWSQQYYIFECTKQ